MIKALMILHAGVVTALDSRLSNLQVILPRPFTFKKLPNQDSPPPSIPPAQGRPPPEPLWAHGDGSVRSKALLTESGHAPALANPQLTLLGRQGGLLGP